MEDEEWLTGPSVEDVLMSVLNSKVGSRMSTRHSRLTSRHHNPGSENKARLDWPRSSQRPGVVGPGAREACRPHAREAEWKPPSLAPPRMKHSVSTPELRSKFMAGHSTATTQDAAKPRAARQVVFLGQEDGKENTHPVLPQHSTPGLPSRPPLKEVEVKAGLVAAKDSTLGHGRGMAALPQRPTGDHGTPALPIPPSRHHARREDMAPPHDVSPPLPDPLHQAHHSAMHRSTPLVRARSANRSNTGPQVNALLAKAQQYTGSHIGSHAGSRVSATLTTHQHCNNSSCTGSELKAAVDRSHTGTDVGVALTRSHTGTEVGMALARSHTGTDVGVALATPQSKAESGAALTKPQSTISPPQQATASNQQTDPHQKAVRATTTSEGSQLPPPSTPASKDQALPELANMDVLAINSKKYLKLELLGRGGSSRVYEVLDLETRKVKAVKVVELEGLDGDTITSYKNEISILQRLRGSDRIIRLYDYELSGSKLSLVMEKGNLDFASILNQARGKKGAPIAPFTVQHYWEGMLLAVQAIHKEGIIHSDLKPANFLMVDQVVKLIDFGIASSIQQDMTSVIKDSQPGTFNYMSPETLLDQHSGPIVNNRSANKPMIKFGVKSDVWSLGCILYNFVYGRTPFQHLTNPLQKLSAISNPNTRISFPDLEDKQLLEVLKLCLQYDPRKRPSIEELLRHPYLTSEAPPDLKQVQQQLAQLSPNTLGKITSMMKQRSDAKPD